MDEIRIGRILRALRRRRGWTRLELAERSRVSQQAIPLVERGHGSWLAAATLRLIFAALDARWEPVVSWRGGELDRLLDEDHARLVAEVVRRLVALDWDVAVEVTYSEYGERGSVDVLGARREFLAMVVVEVKSDLTVMDATVRKADEKERIVRDSLGRKRFGFTPRSVARLLVLPSTDTARRRVRTSATILDSAFPAKGPAVRKWLGDPAGDLAGILFVSDTNRGGDTRVKGGAKRVQRARSSRA